MIEVFSQEEKELYFNQNFQFGHYSTFYSLKFSANQSRSNFSDWLNQLHIGIVTNKRFISLFFEKEENQFLTFGTAKDLDENKNLRLVINTLHTVYARSSSIKQKSWDKMFEKGNSCFLNHKELEDIFPGCLIKQITATRRFTRYGYQLPLLDIHKVREVLFTEYFLKDKLIFFLPLPNNHEKRAFTESESAFFAREEIANLKGSINDRRNRQRSIK